MAEKLSSKGTAKKVLIVEDNEDVRLMMAFYLKSKGFEVIEAACGLEAIEKASEICVDIILMDVALPGMDGLEATEIIKRLDHCAETPIVALTAFSDIKERALKAGCVTILKKPLEFGMLDHAFQTYLR